MAEEKIATQIPATPAVNQQPCEETQQEPPMMTNQEGTTTKETVNADSQTHTWSEITNRLVNQQVIYVSKTTTDSALAQGHHHYVSEGSCFHTKGLRWDDILEMIIANHNQTCDHTGVVFTHDTIQVNVVVDVDDGETQEQKSVSELTSDLTNALALNAGSSDGIETLAAIAASIEDMSQQAKQDEVGGEDGGAKDEAEKGDETVVVARSTISTSKEGPFPVAVTAVKDGSEEVTRDKDHRKFKVATVSSETFPLLRSRKEPEKGVKKAKVLPAECPVCKVRFKSRFALKKHSKVHEEGYAQHACDDCDMICRTEYHLRTHIMAQHSDTKKVAEPHGKQSGASDTKATSLRRNRSDINSSDSKESPSRGKRSASMASDTENSPSRSRRSAGVPKRYRYDDDEDEDDEDEVEDDDVGDGNDEENGKEKRKSEKINEEDADSDKEESSLEDKLKSNEDSEMETQKNAALEEQVSQSPPASGEGKQKKSRTCTICNKTFKFPRNLRKHAKIHMRNTHHPCPHCSKVCKSEHYLRLHMMVHAESKQHKCSVCDDVSFGVQAQLKRHMAKEHSIQEKHTCEVCSAVFTTKYYLQDHMLEHTSKKPLLCEFCGKSFKRQLAHRRHMAYHTALLNPTAHICDRCPKTFPTIALLNQHYRKFHQMERQHLCSVCSIGFFTKVERIKHERVHVEKSLLNIRCVHCGKYFANEQSLAAHKKRHFGQRPFQCQLCGKSYLARYQLKSHMNKAHSAKPSEKNKKPFHCDVCGTSFATRASFINHEKRHAGIKDRQCSYCNASFVTASELLRHVKRHMGGKPYRCGLCNESFAKKLELVVHEGLHNITEEGDPKSVVNNDSVKLVISSNTTDGSSGHSSKPDQTPQNVAPPQGHSEVSSQSTVVVASDETQSATSAIIADGDMVLVDIPLGDELQQVVVAAQVYQQNLSQ